MRQIGNLESRMKSTNARATALTERRRQLVGETAALILSNTQTLSRITANVNGFISFHEARQEANDSEVDCSQVDVINARNELIDTLGSCSFLSKDFVHLNNSSSSSSINTASSISAPSQASASSKSLHTVFNIQNGENGNPQVPTSRQQPSSTSSSSSALSSNSATSSLTVERFKSLPISVRGRVKFEQAQALLDKLHSYSKQQRTLLPKGVKEVPPLSLQAIEASGIKVTGMTGDAVINVLKSLGLIKKSNEGITLIDKGIRG